MKKIFILLLLITTIVIPIQVLAYSFTIQDIEIGNGTQPLSMDMEVIPTTNIGYGEWKVSHMYGIYELDEVEQSREIVFLQNNMTNLPYHISEINFKLGNLGTYIDNYDFLDSSDDITTGMGIFKYTSPTIIGILVGVPTLYNNEHVERFYTQGFSNIVEDSYIYISAIPKTANIYDPSHLESVIHFTFKVKDILELNGLSFDSWDNNGGVEFTLDTSDIPIPSNYKYHGITINLITNAPNVQTVVEPRNAFLYESYLDNFLKNTKISIKVPSIKVNFYNGFEKIHTNYIVEGVDFYPPQDPASPNGYEFLGWRAKNGDIIDFNDFEIKDEYFTSKEIYLSARFINTETGSVLDDSTPINAPQYVIDVLNTLGLNNTFGRFLIFVILIISVSIILLVYKAKLILFIVLYSTLTILFSIMGMIPLFALIIMLLIIVLLFTFLIKGKEVSYE